MVRAAGDKEFASLKMQLVRMGIILNVVSRGENEPEIERHIQTLKERFRATVNTMPFRKRPPRMVVELVYTRSFWLHAPPAANGIYKNMSPREIVSGVAVNAVCHCMLPFGTYVQTHGARQQHEVAHRWRNSAATYRQQARRVLLPQSRNRQEN